MVNLFFFLKFKSQLRKTRSDIVRQIDESLAQTITDAGGKITGDRFVISAVFNDDSIGFWLDMFILIEGLRKNIDSHKDLFGYSLVISGKYPDSPELLCRFLSSYSGIFVDDKAAKKLIPYASFEKPAEWMKKIKKRKLPNSNFYKVREFKTFVSSNQSELNYQNEIIRIFEQEKEKSILILGPSYWQIRAGLYKHVNKINGSFPPLSICFESIGLGAVADIWSSGIRSIAGTVSTEEIDSLWEFLFRERIRDEISEYASKCAKKFLVLVFDFYISAAGKRRKIPILMIENVHLADDSVLDLLIDALADISQSKQRLLLLGTGETSISSSGLKQCDSIFDIIKKIKNTKSDSMYYPPLSGDLWEIIYAISLLSRYFSPEYFQQLFEEDKRNPVMIARAFSILYSLGIIDNTREPRLVKLYLEEYAAKILDYRTDRVKALVCGRLLDWAGMRKINSCFRLLTIIHDLDTSSGQIKPPSENPSDGRRSDDSPHPDGKKKIDDLLLLKSFSSDIVNKTVSGINAALNCGVFDGLIKEKAGVMRHVYETSLALSRGNEDDIENAFSRYLEDNKASDYNAYPVLKAQIIVNDCVYYLGSHNEKKASEKAKEAILLGQNKITFSLPQSYRLYSLVCLSKQQINETIEYMGFALANTERSGNYHEHAVCAYYAAAAYFLYGDVYKAAQFARKSTEQSLDAGSPDWADRARFLQGRIEFELGRYHEAQNIFEKLSREPYGGFSQEKESLLAAWIYRCKIYSHNPNSEKPKARSHDADIFEIEAAYLCGNYQKAVDLSSSYENPFVNEGFLYTERASWRSGFDQCEHLYFTHGEIQTRMILLFRSLALSRLPKTKSENFADVCKEAIRDIQKIVRDEKLCEMDPWAAFYFYAEYKILEQSGASPVNMSTAVSMAFKRLQKRVCRTENVETRHQYLNGPLWNRELNQAAREFKLI